MGLWERTKRGFWGALAGGATGAGIGAMAGPPVGAIPGAAIGAGVGAITGFATGDDEPAPVQRAPVPEEVFDWGPYVEQMAAARGQLSEDPRTTDYFKALESEIMQTMRRRGVQAGEQQAGRGVLSYGDYGAGHAANYAATEMESQLRLGAVGQARQQQVAEARAMFEMIAQEMGFVKGVYDTEFWKVLERYRIEEGVSIERARLEIEETQGYLGLMGQLAQTAALAALLHKRT